MKVKILKSFGGTLYGHRSEGQICDLPEGADWIQAGLAEEIKEERPKKTTKRRTATRPKAETAVQKPAKKN